MKKSIIVLSAFTVMMAFYLTGCNTSDRNNRTDKNNTQWDDTNSKANTQNDFRADIDRYREDVNVQFEKNKKSIAEFNARMTNVNDDSREDYRRRIAVLEQKNNDMKQKLDRYNGNSSDDWNSFKKEFDRDMKNLGDEFRDLTVNSK